VMTFIVDVVKMGFSWEAHKMITGSAVPRLITHILKTVPKDTTSSELIHSADDTYLSTSLNCVGA